MRRHAKSMLIGALALAGCATAPTPATPAPSPSDSITLARSLCYGFCPSYTVTVERDGDVVFVGQQHVERPGEHRAEVDPAEAARLFAMAHAANFYALRDAYRAEITDIPSYTITLREGEREKSVVDYGGAMVGMPASVRALQDEIDRVAGSAQWVGEAAR